MTNLYEQFVDDAKDCASFIDNKPVFAVDYLNEGIEELVLEYTVTEPFARAAIMSYIETPQGRVGARGGYCTE